MTGNCWPFFCFTSHLSVYLPVSTSNVVCESVLIWITFKMPLCFYTPLQRSHHNPGCLKTFQCKTELFIHFYFIAQINGIRLLEFIRPIGNSIYRIHDPFGMKHLNRLRVGFSHLQEHKLGHYFADIFNPWCACALETECTEHFFLHCHSGISFRTTLMNELCDIVIDSSLVWHISNDILSVILCGDKRSNPYINKKILAVTI